MKAGQTDTGKGSCELTSQGFWKVTGTGIWTEGGQLLAEMEAGLTNRCGNAGGINCTGWTEKLTRFNEIISDLGPYLLFDLSYVQIKGNQF